MRQVNLISLAQWRREYFQVPVHPRTSQKWARKGLIPAHKIGHTWYIDLDAWDPVSSPLIAAVKKAAQEKNQ